MTKFKLNNQLIGHGCQPFIIAEAGINHNGEIKNKSQVTKNDLEKFCKDKITSYKQPKKIIIINDLVGLNEIPKGPTKKILYRKLKEYYRNSF